jgi:exodeoxyribonuclease VII large subunit
MARAAGAGVASLLEESTERLQSLDLARALVASFEMADARRSAAVAALEQLDLKGRVVNLATALGSLRFTDQVGHRWRRASETLGARHSTLVALDPRRVLARGYAVVRSDGQVLRDAASVGAGAALEIELARGTLHATAGLAEPGGARGAEAS